MEERLAQLVSQVKSLKPESVSKPTLVYFDIVGIGWPIRALLHLQNIDYHYIPITIMDWMTPGPDGIPALKHAFRNHHMPLYVDQEVYLDQSMLIVTTLATRAGMMGNNEEERIAVQAVLAHCYDALFHFNGLMPVNVRLNIADDVVQARLDSFMGGAPWGLATNGYRNQLSAFMNYLESNQQDSGFMVGNTMTAADLWSFNVLCNWFKAFDREVFSTEFPVLDNYIQHIAEQPGIADYIRDVQEPTIWFPLPTVAMRLTSPEELQGLVSLPQ
ncbi:MAG: glutathione S-transferase family protein [Halioglobus sp.]